jgi:chromosome segregation ATPase
MRKWKRIPSFLLTSACLLFLFGCDDVEKQKALAEAEEAKTQLTKLQETLEKAQKERDSFKMESAKLSESLQEAKAGLAKEIQVREGLQSRYDEINVSRDGLKEQVIKLTKSCDNLQQQVKDLIHSRDSLRRQIDTLIQVRDELRQAALIDAKNAQEKVQELTAQMQKHVIDISELSDSVMILQLSFTQLKNRLMQLNITPADQL